MLHAISVISVKLCQFKGSTPKLKVTNWFLFWFFPRGDSAVAVAVNKIKIELAFKEMLNFQALYYYI